MTVDGKPVAVACSHTEQATTDASGAVGFGALPSGNPRRWSYTYETYGRVLTATDPNGKRTTWTYYADDDADLGKRGNVKTITNAAGHVTRFTDYNLHALPTRVMDPNGLVSTFEYDSRMRVRVQTVGAEVTRFEHDPAHGQITRTTLPDGSSLTFGYDTAYRLTSVADHRGNRVDYTLDAAGNRVQERTKDPDGALVRNITRVVDALNRVERVTGASR
jgi:YD repeat-containing protein